MTDTDVNNTVLLNTFTIGKKRCKVYFHRGTLVWDSQKPPNSHFTLPIEDVLSVQHNELSSRDGSSKDSNSFTVHYAKSNSKNVWRYNSVVMRHVDPMQVASWVKTLQNHLNNFNRPKNLLLFINPYGGKKEALKIFEKYGKPLFHIAGVEVHVVVSQRANQIKDIILSLDLRNFDGIACVGGDGTFSEVFNGLVLRVCKEQGLNADSIETELPQPTMPIGVIPGGSTDTVAYCLHGTTDVQTAVLQIIFGDRRGLDLVSVYNERCLLKLYASVLSYGYLGDIILQSEKYRWMGPKRYDFTGFRKLLANAGYEGEIVMCSESSVDGASKCVASCLCCSTKKHKQNCNKSEQNWKTVKGKFFMVSGANITCACARSPNGISPFCHIGDGCVDLVLVRHTSLINNVRLLLRLSSKTKTVVMLSALGIPPVNVPLIAQQDLPFVEIHRAREFCFRANPRNTMDSEPQVIPGLSTWNCDGEVIHDTDLSAKVRCQLIWVYGRGFQQCTKKIGCCGLKSS